MRMSHNWCIETYAAEVYNYRWRSEIWAHRNYNIPEIANFVERKYFWIVCILAIANEAILSPSFIEIVSKAEKWKMARAIWLLIITERLL